MAAECQKRAPRPTIAIIGGGPSGCYTAQFLRKELPEAQITVFEALPVPYGLIRYGVAADHQGTKAITAQFDKMFRCADVSFVGNTRIGVDVDVAAITESFDVVVVATGLVNDRPLPVPHDDGAHIVGAGRILRSLNAFPSLATSGMLPFSDALGEDLVVVGHGNVAIDVVRLLAKPTEHFRGSDIHDDALRALRPSVPTSIRVIGRSSAESAKFDLAMLRELCALDTVRIAVEGLHDHTTGLVADLLRETTARHVAENFDATRLSTSVTFHFQTVPISVRLEEKRTVLDATNPSGKPASFFADTVITAIGFCHDAGIEESQWVSPHVYRVGWFERGGLGNIAENRRQAIQTAKTIVTDLRLHRLLSGKRAGLSAVRDTLPQDAVDFAGWQAIDAAERHAADDQRCRRKIVDIDQMLAIARAGSSLSAGA